MWYAIDSLIAKVLEVSLIPHPPHVASERRQNRADRDYDFGERREHLSDGGLAVPPLDPGSQAIRR